MEEGATGDLSSIEKSALAAWGNFIGNQQNKKKIAQRHQGENV